MVDDSEYEEPVECNSCGETPELHYDPTVDDSYKLRCGCELTSADVTSCLNELSLAEMTGKWSNLDYDSTMRYDDR